MENAFYDSDYDQDGSGTWLKILSEWKKDLQQQDHLSRPRKQVWLLKSRRSF